MKHSYYHRVNIIKFICVPVPFVTNLGRYIVQLFTEIRLVMHF